MVLPKGCSVLVVVGSETVISMCENINRLLTLFQSVENGWILPVQYSTLWRIRYGGSSGSSESETHSISQVLRIQRLILSLAFGSQITSSICCQAVAKNCTEHAILQMRSGSVLITG